METLERRHIGLEASVLKLPYVAEYLDMSCSRITRVLLCDGENHGSNPSGHVWVFSVFLGVVPGWHYPKYYRDETLIVSYNPNLSGK